MRVMTPAVAAPRAAQEGAGAGARRPHDLGSSAAVSVSLSGEGRPKALIAPPPGAAPRRKPQAWGSSSIPTGPAKAIPVPAAGARSCAPATHEKELFGGEAHTTNNRMELTAVIRALRVAQASLAPWTLFTDSQYVKNGIETLDPRLAPQRLEDGGQEARQERGPVARARRGSSRATRSRGTGCKRPRGRCRTTIAPMRWPTAAWKRRASALTRLLDPPSRTPPFPCRPACRPCVPPPRCLRDRRPAPPRPGRRRPARGRAPSTRRCNPGSSSTARRRCPTATSLAARLQILVAERKAQQCAVLARGEHALEVDESGRWPAVMATCRMNSPVSQSIAAHRIDHLRSSPLSLPSIVAYSQPSVPRR